MVVGIRYKAPVTVLSFGIIANSLLCQPEMVLCNVYSMRLGSVQCELQEVTSCAAAHLQNHLSRV